MESSLKAKIKWQCRRGMLELDLLLNQFVDKSIDKLAPEEVDALLLLLKQPDPVLYDWFFGAGLSDNKDLIKIVQCIKLQYSAEKIA